MLLLDNGIGKLKSLFHITKSLIQKLTWAFLLPLMKYKLKISRASYFLTCERDDGGGAQIHGRISTWILANQIGVSFQNTPMTSVHFGVGENWAKDWNSLITFPESTKVPSKTICKNSAFAFAFDLLIASPFRKGDIQYSLVHAHDYTNHFVRQLNDIRTTLREIKLKRNTSQMAQIVIHLRRGFDANSDNSVRFTKNTQLFAVVKNLRSIYPEKSIRIFSNEHDADLAADLLGLATLDTTSDVFSAFEAMVGAEVLVIAKSSLSYVAGMISDGIVYSEPFWHPPMPNWNNIEALTV